jgi:mono/diheme cytochrome c family protein
MQLTWEITLNHSLGILLALCLSCGDAFLDSASDQVSDSGDSALSGEELYVLHCSACHGLVGEGTDVGPELMHTSQKEDEKILGVILEGKGSMQPVEVTESEAQLIVDHLRVLFPPGEMR